MRLVIQVAEDAKCTVDGNITGQINKGFMILVGIGLDDDKDIVRKYAAKVSKLRIFEDENGKINKNIYDIGGSILSISQFTLYADTTKGNRPSFTNALAGEKAKELYDYFNECLRELGIHVETGIFGAMMKISFTNDGPLTIIMDSKEKQ